jgi:hypothetical protein
MLKGKSLSVVGSYLPMASLWTLCILALIGLLVVAFVIPNFLPGILFVIMLLGGTEIMLVVEAKGISLIFLSQILFRFFFAPRLVVPESDKKVSKLSYFLHPDLRGNPFRALAYLFLIFLYLFFGLFLFFTFTSGLIPPNAPIWDSWMFN